MRGALNDGGEVCVNQFVGFTRRACGLYVSVRCVPKSIPKVVLVVGKYLTWSFLPCFCMCVICIRIGDTLHAAWKSVRAFEVKSVRLLSS